MAIIFNWNYSRGKFNTQGEGRRIINGIVDLKIVLKEFLLRFEFDGEFYVPIWRRRGTTRRLINRLPFENRFSDGEKTTRRLLDRNEFDRFNRDRVIYPWKERRVCSSWRDVTLIESATAGEIGGVTAAHGEQERWLPIFRTTRRKNILKDLQRTLSLPWGGNWRQGWLLPRASSQIAVLSAHTRSTDVKIHLK